jgi:hypothetical protein
LLALLALLTRLRRLLRALLATGLLTAGLLTWFAAGLLTRFARLLSGLAAALRIVACHLLCTIPSLTRTLSLAFALTFAATLLISVRLLVTLTFALAGLAAFGPGLARGRLSTFALLIAGLALIALVALARLPAVFTFAVLCAAGLCDLALQLISKRVEFRLRELELLRVIPENAFRRAFHAAAQLIDFGARGLPGLPRLREIPLAQHFARKIKHLAALFAFGRLLQAIIKITRHPAAVEQLRTRLLHRVRVIAADFAHAVVELTREQRLGVLGLLRDLSTALGERGGRDEEEVLALDERAQAVVDLLSGRGHATPAPDCSGLVEREPSKLAARHGVDKERTRSLRRR